MYAEVFIISAPVLRVKGALVPCFALVGGWCFGGKVTQQERFKNGLAVILPNSTIIKTSHKGYLDLSPEISSITRESLVRVKVLML